MRETARTWVGATVGSKLGGLVRAFERLWASASSSEKGMLRVMPTAQDGQDNAQVRIHAAQRGPDTQEAHDCICSRKKGSPAPSATENQKVLVQDLGAAGAKESLGSAETGGSFQAREEGS